MHGETVKLTRTVSYYLLPRGFGERGFCWQLV